MSSRRPTEPAWSSLCAHPPGWSGVGLPVPSGPVTLRLRAHPDSRAPREAAPVSALGRGQKQPADPPGLTGHLPGQGTATEHVSPTPLSGKFVVPLMSVRRRLRPMKLRLSRNGRHAEILLLFINRPPPLVPRKLRLRPRKLRSRRYRTRLLSLSLALPRAEKLNPAV